MGAPTRFVPGSREPCCLMTTPAADLTAADISAFRYF
jgi:hypothetical protein